MWPLSVGASSSIVITKEYKINGAQAALYTTPLNHVLMFNDLWNRELICQGDSFLIWYWLNQHGKEAMLDMPLWSCQLQQHILADPVTSF